VTAAGPLAPLRRASDTSARSLTPIDVLASSRTPFEGSVASVPRDGLPSEGMLPSTRVTLNPNRVESCDAPR